MAALPRQTRGGGEEELRVTFTRAKTHDAKEITWHSIRIFWRADDGQWRPGKQGITIRGRELRGVADALAKAVEGGAVREERRIR